jgi:RNA recognition motif
MQQQVAIFVGDLRANINEKHLFEAFSKFGSVFSCFVIRSKSTGASKGYGFVRFAEPSGAEAALSQGTISLANGSSSCVVRRADNSSGHTHLIHLYLSRLSRAQLPVHDTAKLAAALSKFCSNVPISRADMSGDGRRCRVTFACHDHAAIAWRKVCTSGPILASWFDDPNDDDNDGGGDDDVERQQREQRQRELQHVQMIQQQQQEIQRQQQKQQIQIMQQQRVDLLPPPQHAFDPRAMSAYRSWDSLTPFTARRRAPPPTQRSPSSPSSSSPLEYYLS